MEPGHRDLTMQTNPIRLQANDNRPRGRSGILRVLVVLGDAAGMPFECNLPEQMHSPDMIEMLMPESFGKPYAATP